jgi:predicted transcriptional regulator
MTVNGGGRDGASVRRERLQALLGLAADEGDEAKVRAVFMLKTGLTLRRIDEMLCDLEAAGLIERREGKIKLVE